MKEVMVKKIEAYLWECPECGYFNVQDKGYKVICSDCYREFKTKEKVVD